MLGWHQHLFYHNKKSYLYKNGVSVEFNKKQKTEIFSWAINHTRLRHEKRPFFIFNGNQSIDFSGVDKAEHCTAFYFFEPLTYYGNRVGYQDHILRFDSPDDVRSYELDSVKEYITKHNLQDCKVYLPDRFAADYFRKVYNLDFEWYDPYFYAEAHRLNLLGRVIPHVIYQQKITKKLWLGTWRYDPVRHYILADLVSKGCHTGNNFSWFYTINSNEIENVMWCNVDEQTKNKLLNLNTVTPLTIDTETECAVHYTNFYPPVAQKTKDPVKFYQQSFCILVVETRVAQPWVNLSEKTLHAIKNRKPFLLYAAPQSLKTLHDLGFKTFDLWWDESYDDIVDTQLRIQKINSIAEYINSLDVKILRDIYKQMKPTLLHNLRVLQNLQRRE